MSGRAAVKDFIFSKSLPLATALIIIAACAFALEVAAENAGSSGSTAESPGTLDVAAVLAGAESVFVSDYFSFIGADEKGHVAFAIDNNRSRRGRKFSADAHVVLHDCRSSRLLRRTPISHRLGGCYPCPSQAAPWKDSEAQWPSGRQRQPAR